MVAVSFRNAEKIITQEGFGRRRATVTCPTRVLAKPEGVTSMTKKKTAAWRNSIAGPGIHSARWNSLKNCPAQNKLLGVQWSRWLFPMQQVRSVGNRLLEYGFMSGKAKRKLRFILTLTLQLVKEKGIFLLSWQAEMPWSWCPHIAQIHFYLQLPEKKDLIERTKREHRLVAS